MEQTTIGCYTFKYTRDQVEKISDHLNANGGNVLKAFDTLWRMPIFEHCERDDAPFVLDLIERVHSIHVVFHRDHKLIWDVISGKPVSTSLD